MRTIKLCLVPEALAVCLLSAVIVATAGCSTEPDDERVPLEDVSALLVAQSDGTDTLVFGSFSNLGSSTLYHFPIDSVNGSFGSQAVTIPMAYTSSDFHQSFFDRSEGTVKLSFAGPNVDDSTTTQLALPAPFTPVFQQTQVRRDQAVVVELGNPGTNDELNYSLHGDCVEGSFELVADVAELRIEPSRLVELPGQEQQACKVVMYIVRTRSGEVGSGFGKGGRSMAQQSRYVTFESLPRAAAAPMSE